MINNSDYITTGELAKELGVSRVTIFKKVKSGEIPSEIVGGRYLIPVSYLQKITGKDLSKSDQDSLSRAVDRVVKDYGEAIKLLGDE